MIEALDFVERHGDSDDRRIMQAAVTQLQAVYEDLTALRAGRPNPDIPHTREQLIRLSWVLSRLIRERMETLTEHLWISEHTDDFFREFT